MGTTSDKLNKLIDTKSNIRDSIISKGVDVPVELPFDEYPNRIIEISTGGVIPDPNNPVLFFDYDGTLLYSYTEEEARELTEFPAHPEHDLLTPDGWTHTLEEINNFVGALHIGAQYRTTDGRTHIWGVLTRASGYVLSLQFGWNGGTGATRMSVDWGDGQTQIITGGTVAVYEHDYANGDDIIPYHISLGFSQSQGTATCTLGGGSSGTFVGASYPIRRATLTKIYIGEASRLNGYAFQGCYSLTSATIPKGTLLASVSRGYEFQNCYSLASIIIPNDITRIENFAFRDCYSLASIVIPNSVSIIAANAFQNNYSLTSIVIPESVYSIETYAFSGCLKIKSMVFKREIPPSAGSSFLSAGALQKCYVLDGSVEVYKTATNWATYTNYIYPLSSRP